MNCRCKIAAAGAQIQATEESVLQSDCGATSNSTAVTATRLLSNATPGLFTSRSANLRKAKQCRGLAGCVSRPSAITTGDGFGQIETEHRRPVQLRHVPLTAVRITSRRGPAIANAVNAGGTGVTAQRDVNRRWNHGSDIGTCRGRQARAIISRSRARSANARSGPAWNTMVNPAAGYADSGYIAAFTVNDVALPDSHK